MELEDKFLETMQVLKGIADSIKREAQQKNNSKVQEQLKELIKGFKDELEKGNASRKELANKLNESKDLKPEEEKKQAQEKVELSKLDKYLFEKLDDVRTKAEKLAKDNNISWAICKEFKPKHSRDSIKSTLDLLIDKAKNKVEQQDRNTSKEKVKTLEPKEEKTKTKSR